MKKIIIGLIIGILIGIGLFALILVVKQNYMVNKYIEVENTYGEIKEYEIVMQENKNRLNNYNNESAVVSFNCINSIKKIIEESEKTYFVGNVGLKEEKTKYFNSYSIMNVLYQEIKKTCPLKENTNNIIYSVLMTNNSIVSEDYTDFITNSKEKAVLLSKTPITNNMTRNILKKNEAYLIELIINDVFI